jgi:hypothetical protein
MNAYRTFTPVSTWYSTPTVGVVSHPDMSGDS